MVIGDSPGENFTITVKPHGEIVKVWGIGEILVKFE
ncbi:MAG: hypothetical protein XD54_0745 [Thermococcus sibiricus]|uniref:Uncharacterized protein n=1 Tax=Thermococcus sibiricus TaxID=172049 RepID=A0A101EMB9_9EURY|nr:MAG: hypothetical protein XD54_0745 [Thermococcus sibiricus]